MKGSDKHMEEQKNDGVVGGDEKEEGVVKDQKTEAQIKAPPKVLMEPSLELVEEVKKWVGVHEKGGDNRGPEVDMFNKTLNDTVSHAWCASFVAYCVRSVEKKTGIKTSVNLSEHVMTMWNSSTGRQVKIGGQRPGDIAVWNKVGTGSGHCGVVTRVIKSKEFIETVEGNTSDSSGVERNGQGIYTKQRRVKQIGDMKLLGFLRVFA